MTGPDAPGPSAAPMERGAYNRNSRVQAAGLAPAIDWFAEAAAEVPLPSAGPVGIADYGAAQGHNSFAPVTAALEALAPRLALGRPVVVSHTDLPDNDWGALFHTLATDPDSYLRPGVYPVAVGRSFYGQILPPASVTLGWSSWSVQWLSRTPAPIPDQVEVAFSRDPAARAAYAAQAAADWRAFLAARAAELVPGGRLVVLTMARDASGDFGHDALLAALWTALLDRVADGTVTADERARMAIPTVGRSHEDLLAPFAEGPVDGLGVRRVEVFAAEDRIWRDYAADGDAAAFGARWAGFSRASVFPTLAAAIADPGRRAAFFDRTAADLAARLAAAPAPANIPLARVDLEKARG